MFVQHCAHRLDVDRVRRGIDRPARRRHEQLLRQHVIEQGMHAGYRVAYRHRVQRVAVIAVAQRNETRLRRQVPAAPVLDRHLQGDLDGHRTGIGEEHQVESVGGDVDQPLGQGDRRRMSDAAEHHVRHGVELLRYRRVQARVVVAVNHTPPRRHAIDQLAPVGEAQFHAAGGDHGHGSGAGTDRAVGMPDEFAVALLQGVGVRCRFHVRSIACKSAGHDSNQQARTCHPTDRSSTVTRTIDPSHKTRHSF